MLASLESLAPDSPAAAAHDGPDAGLAFAPRGCRTRWRRGRVCVRTHERGGDTAVSIGVVSPAGEHRERRLAFLGGSLGRTRAALLAAAVLLAALPPAASDPSGSDLPVEAS